MCDSRIFPSHTLDTPALVDTDTSHHGVLANLDAAALLRWTERLHASKAAPVATPKPTPTAGGITAIATFVTTISNGLAFSHSASAAARISSGSEDKPVTSGTVNPDTTSVDVSRAWPGRINPWHSHTLGPMTRIAETNGGSRTYSVERSFIGGQY